MKKTRHTEGSLPTAITIKIQRRLPSLSLYQPHPQHFLRLQRCNDSLESGVRHCERRITNRSGSIGTQAPPSEIQHGHHNLGIRSWSLNSVNLSVHSNFLTENIPLFSRKFTKQMTSEERLRQRVIEEMKETWKNEDEDDNIEEQTLLKRFLNQIRSFPERVQPYFTGFIERLREKIAHYRMKPKKVDSKSEIEKASSENLLSKITSEIKEALDKGHKKDENENEDEDTHLLQH